MKFSSYFAKAFMEKRKQLGHSQIWLAKKTGMSRLSIFNYESGQSVMSIHHCVLISNALGLQLNNLVNDWQQKNTIYDEIDKLPSTELQKTLRKTLKELE